MYNKNLVSNIFRQIDESIDKIIYRTKDIKSADDFTHTPEGMEKLDSICMLFIVIGESLKNIDKITGQTLLNNYTEIDWKGIKGFRDIVAHHYFDIDAEEIFWICSNTLLPLSQIIKKIIKDLDNDL